MLAERGWRRIWEPPLNVVQVPWEVMPTGDLLVWRGSRIIPCPVHL